MTWYMFDNFMGIDLSKDGHSTVSWKQLTDWQSCPEWEVRNLIAVHPSLCMTWGLG